MITLKLIHDELSAMRDIISDVGELRKLVQKLASNARPVVGHLSKAVSHPNSNTQMEAIKATQGTLKRVRDVAREADLEDTVMRARVLIDRLGESASSDVVFGQAAQQLSMAARSFLDVYKTFVPNQSHGESLDLLLAAMELRDAFDAVVGLVEQLLPKLEPPRQVPEHKALLEFQLPAEPTFEGVGHKVAMVHALYVLIASAVGEDPDEHPLEIIRLEVGTISFLALGGRASVFVFKQICKRVVAAVSRRGRADTMKAELDVALRMHDFANALAEQGLDATPILAALEASSNEIADRFSDLFDEPGMVAVDGERFVMPAHEPEALPGHVVRALPPARGRYRKAVRGKVWHCCSNCSNWPEADFEVADELPDGARLDRECNAKIRRDACDTPLP